MRKAIYITAIITIISMYYFYISHWDKIDTASLGTLGDFIGGNTTPILTFISTIILIDSFVMQRQSAAEAKESEKASKELVEKQAKLSDQQSFESSMFNLLNVCFTEYKNSEYMLPGSAVLRGTQLFQLYLNEYKEDKSGLPKADLISNLENKYSHTLYENVKSFSSLYRFITLNAQKEKCEEYISMVLMLTPKFFLELLCIVKNHTDWGVLKYYDQCGIFDRDSVKLFLNYYA